MIAFPPMEECPMSLLDLLPFSLFSADQIFEFPDFPDSATALLRHIEYLGSKTQRLKFCYIKHPF